MSRKKNSSKAKSEPPGHGPISNKPDTPLKLEVVLKCDSAGSVEAVRTAIDAVSVPGVRLLVIQAGIFIPDRKQANIGDEVECFETAEVREVSPWHPTCGIFNRG